MHISKYIPISTIIKEWIEDTDQNDSQINKGRLTRWAMDRARVLTTADQYVPKISLLHVKNGIATLPIDFKYVMEVAYRLPVKDRCTSFPEVVEWTANLYDCDYTLRKENIAITKECKSCEVDTVELNVDRVFMDQYPWHYFQVKNFTHRKGVVGLSKYPESVLNREFRLMTYASDPFFNIGMHIPDCRNLKVTGSPQYAINEGVLNTDAEDDTEILFSYLGIKTGDDGDIMVPDTPNAVEAIKDYLTYKTFSGMFFKTRSPQDRLAAREYQVIADDSLGRAKSELDSLEYHELWDTLERTYLGELPNYKLTGSGRTQTKNYLDEHSHTEYTRRRARFRHPRY